jgi:hypothetical protein
VNRNQTMLAVGLEVGPGTLLQTFGIGHMYAGRYSTGLAIMFSYWVLQAINTMLMSVGIGFVTAPLTWLAYMIFAPTNLIGDPKKY